MRVGLVERAMGGDQEAFASLAARQRRRLLPARVPDPAGPAPGRGRRPAGAPRRLARPAHAPRPGAFDAWLHRLVVNACYTEARGERAMGRQDPGHSHRQLARTGRGALRRRPGRARRRVPPADTGAAGGRRPAPPPGVSAHGDRGDPGHPRRDRAVPPPLRGPSAAGRARRTKDAPSRRPRSDRHEPNPRRAPTSTRASRTGSRPILTSRRAEVLATVLAAFPSIPQRRASRVPRRFQTMNRLALFGAAAAIVVAAGLGGLALSSGGVPRGRTPAPTRSTAPTTPHLRRRYRRSRLTSTQPALTGCLRRRITTATASPVNPGWTTQPGDRDAGPGPTTRGRSSTTARDVHGQRGVPGARAVVRR